MSDQLSLFDETRNQAGHRLTPAARLTDPVTSAHGAADVAERAPTHRDRLLAVYRTNPDGLTDEEAAALAALPARSCWWKRCSELRQLGRIVPTGETRTGATGSEQMVCVYVEGISE